MGEERAGGHAVKGHHPVWRLLGPGFVAAVAYVDPGNVAANLSAGAEYGYLLVWVLVAANLMAMLVQYLSAKLGLVSGHTLPELIGERIGTRAGRLLFWFQAEIVAAATDLAEVIGGAVALQLLLGLPLLVGGLVIGAVSLLLLVLGSRRGPRVFELSITGLLVVVTLGFVAGLVVSPVDWGGVAAGLEPRFRGRDTVLLAASMLGATVMPHAVYMHSSLVRDRHGVSEEPGRIRMLVRATRWDILLSLLVAGTVNVAMLVLAASSLSGLTGIDGIDTAYDAIRTRLGAGVGLAFAVGLLASGLASTSVGAYAGSEIMDGLLHVRVPMIVRRLVTLVPALLILATGFSPSRALVLSQVLLSLGLPWAVIPLIRVTGDRRVMGRFANPHWLRVTSWAVAGLICLLNIALVVLTLA